MQVVKPVNKHSIVEPMFITYLKFYTNRLLVGLQTVGVMACKTLCTLLRISSNKPCPWSFTDLYCLRTSKSNVK